MNWKDISATVKSAALSGLWPNIRAFFDEGVYILNDRDNWKMNYATVILDLQSATVTEDTTTFNVLLWYIDRQKEDRSDINNILSDAIMTLGEMANWLRYNLDGVFITSDMIVTPFQDKFADECAGASISIHFSSVHNKLC